MLGDSGQMERDPYSQDEQEKQEGKAAHATIVIVLGIFSV